MIAPSRRPLAVAASLLISLLGLPSWAVAQGAAVPVTLSGEVRVRSEADGRTAARDPDLVSLLRTRVGLVAAPSLAVRAVIRLSDSRIFGEEANSLTDVTASRVLAKGLALMTGASVFSPADAAANPGIALGGATLWWGYVQLTATF